MANEKPTKPLFTARFTLVNTTHYTVDQIRKAFEPALKAAGFVIYQTPAVNKYKAAYSLTKDGPYEGDDTGAITEIMSIEGPAGKAIAVAKDIVNDPAGSRPILEKRLPNVTAIAWNIGAPKNVVLTSVPQALSDLLWKTRKEKIADNDKYTGIGWTPVVARWEDAPVKLPPYPDRPPIPASLIPVKPKPVEPKPKPVEPKPKPDVVVKPPPPPPPPVPVPVVQKPKWPYYLGGLAALFLLFGDNK